MVTEEAFKKTRGLHAPWLPFPVTGDKINPTVWVEKDDLPTNFLLDFQIRFLRGNSPHTIGFLSSLYHNLVKTFGCMAYITKMLEGPLPFKRSNSSLFSVLGDFLMLN